MTQEEFQRTSQALFEESGRVQAETNRRLNRRCQELEKEIAKRDRADRHVMDSMRIELNRLHNYANRLRDQFHENTHSIHESYRKAWERLPKPGQWEDSIYSRVDHTVKLLERQKEQNKHQIRIFLDGDCWCALIGDNIQEGECGFGSTPFEAMRMLVARKTLANNNQEQNTIDDIHTAT